MDGDDGFSENRTGYYVTVGYDLAPAHRILARLDSFRDSRDLLLGYNVSLSQAAAAQVNLGIPLTDDDGTGDLGPGRTRALLNVQLAF